VNPNLKRQSLDPTLWDFEEDFTSGSEPTGSMTISATTNSSAKDEFRVQGSGFRVQGSGFRV